jgi:UDP:flavonoid glycosyltransferase YjiC (YdhE family)
MFGALRAAVPAVVIAQAFDQSYCAQLVEHAGVGYDVHQHGLQSALSKSLAGSALRARARALADKLVDSRAAAVAAAAQILEAAARS